MNNFNCLGAYLETYIKGFPWAFLKYHYLFFFFGLIFSIHASQYELMEIGNCSDLEIAGYKSFVQCSTPNQSRKGGRNCGGIALFYKNNLHKHISITNSTQNYIWFRIKKGYLNSMKDTYVCGIYIPPCNSKYFDLEIFKQFCNPILDLDRIIKSSAYNNEFILVPSGRPNGSDSVFPNKYGKLFI